MGGQFCSQVPLGHTRGPDAGSGLGRQLRVPGLRGQHLLWHKVSKLVPLAWKVSSLATPRLLRVRPVRHCSLVYSARCAGAVMEPKPHCIIIACYFLVWMDLGLFNFSCDFFNDHCVFFLVGRSLSPHCKLIFSISQD